MFLFWITAETMHGNHSMHSDETAKVLATDFSPGWNPHILWLIKLFFAQMKKDISVGLTFHGEENKQTKMA